ncbi:uncharacterized protein LOC9652715 [Selaginella moellendorffii]|uniref:uncharacterized protein LOC9652715 n=1 Tax=Selaginella moellendorffii TaxID=88036 RepID=UPI000D1CCA65|nr:uncharacterized protein LOC9652715 [Selaginella moellendorffii]|eukprot:XP_024527230.1 uncharacterized protein LOC9652715 [Selaginella moellendorffii]
MELSRFVHWFLWWSWLLWAPRFVISQPGRDCLMLCSQNITCALECAACDFDCCSSTCDSARPGAVCDPFCYVSSLDVSDCCVSAPSPPPTPAPIIPGPGNCSVIDILAVNITMVEGVPFTFNIVAIDSSCSGSTCSCTTPYDGSPSLFQVRIFDSGTGFTPPNTACNVSEGSSSGVFSVSCLAQNSIADANAQYILFVTLFSYGFWVVPIGFSSPAITIISGPVYVPACVATWSNNSSTFVAGTMATLQITQKDAFNNTVGGKTGRSVLYSFQLAVIANPAVNTSTSFPSFNVSGNATEGSQTVSFYPTTAGRFYLQVGNGTHVIQKAPFRFYVVPGPLSINDSSAVWPNGVNSFEAGTNSSLAILQLDGFSNSIPNMELLLSFYYSDGSTLAPLNVTVAPLEIDTDYIAATFMPIQAGQYYLHVGNGSQELQLSPFTFSVFSGSIAVENCKGSWTGFKSTFYAGERAEFNVLEMDGYGNNVSLSTGSLSSYDFSVNVSTASDYQLFAMPSLALLPPELGSAYRIVTFYPQVSGTYLLNVGSDIVNISNSPFLFRVFPGPISIPTCMGFWPNGSQFQAGVNGSLQIFKRDKYNNSVYDPYVFIGTIVSLSSDIPVGSLPDLGVQVQNINGTDYNLMTFMSTLSGDFACEVGSSTDTITNSPLGFFVNASSVSTSACLPSWPKGLNRFPAGTEATLHVLLKDVYNNTVSSITGGYDYNFQLSADISGSANSSLGYNVSFADNPSAGIKTVKFYPTLAGSYWLGLWSPSANLTGSPFQFTVTAGSVSVWNCTASWLGGVNVFDAGTQAVIQILLMDAYGNNVSLATGRNDSYNFVVEVQGYPDAINNWNVTVVPQNFSGYQSVVFFPVDAGQFNLRIGSKSKNISGSPFPLTVNPGFLSVPDCSGEWLNGIEFYLQNTTVTFLLYPKDVFGNALPSNGLTAANFTALVYFQSNLSMLGVPSLAVTQMTNYSLAFRFNMTKVGRFILQIGNASEDISGSPYLFTVTTDNVDPSRTIIDGTGLKNSTAGVKSEFLVQLRDSAGNTAYANASDMSVRFTRFGLPINVTTNISIVPKSSGAFLIAYVPTLAGDYKIVTQWKGLVLGGGPAIKKSVLPASIYGPWCRATYSGVSQGEAGLTTSFLVTTFDAFNNTMPTGPVNISIKFSPAVTQATTITNNRNGTYTVKCNVTKSGTYGVFVYAGSLTPSNLTTGSPFQITVSSGPIAISQCRGVFMDGNVISEGSAVRFLLLLRDKFKNKVYQVLNETVTAMFTASVYTTGGEGPVFTSDMTVQQFATFTYASDQVLIAFTMTERGDFKLQVVSGLTKINSGVPYYFSIVQEAPSVLNSTFNGTGIIDSTAGDLTTISITLRDHFGYPVVTDTSLIVVNASSMDDTFFLLAKVFELQAEDGRYVSNYTATVAGDYTVSISWSDVRLVSYNKTVSPGTSSHSF